MNALCRTVEAHRAHGWMDVERAGGALLHCPGVAADDTDMTPEQFRAAAAAGEPARVVASQGEAERLDAVEAFSAALDAHPWKIEHGLAYVDDDKETIVGALLAYGWRPPVRTELVLAPGRWEAMVTQAIADLAARHGLPADEVARSFARSLPSRGQATVARPVTPPHPTGPSSPPPERDV